MQTLPFLFLGFKEIQVITVVFDLLFFLLGRLHSSDRGCIEYLTFACEVCNVLSFVEDFYTVIHKLCLLNQVLFVSMRSEDIMFCCRHLLSSTGSGDLLGSLLDHILFNPNLWVKASPKVNILCRCGHFYVWAFTSMFLCRALKATLVI